MRSVLGLFGRSPFEPLVGHARKVHECIAKVLPLAEAVLAGDAEQVEKLQHEVSQAEYEADQIKDNVRQGLPKRYYLPVRWSDMAGFLRQVDRIADAAEDFAVVATFRPLRLPPELHEEFRELARKAVQVNEALLGVAEKLATLQKEAFVGSEPDEVLRRIQDVCRMEWESDKLSRRLARHAYAIGGLDPVTLLLLEKLAGALSKLADHAENAGKNLRLMIMRK